MPRSRNRIKGQFDARPIEMLESAAFRASSLSCRLILDRIAIEHAHHGGKENGKLPVTYNQFVEYGLHRHAISPGIREGEALGLFFVTVRGRANAGEFRSPNKFRLPYRPCGNNEPTNEWRQIKTTDEAELIARAARKQATTYRSRKTRTNCSTIAEYAS